MQNHFLLVFISIFLCQSHAINTTHSYAHSKKAPRFTKKTKKSSSLNQKYHPQNYVYIINNGQLELKINNVIIPAGKSLKQAHIVPVYEQLLLIEIPNIPRKNAMQKIHLKQADIGNTVKVGAYFDTQRNIYNVTLLRANKIPLLVTLRKKTHGISIPKELKTIKLQTGVI